MPSVAPYSGFLLMLVVIGCCDKRDLLQNDLTKSVDMITEYSIEVITDSDNQTVYDTLSVTSVYFDNEDLATRRTTEFSSDDKIRVDIIRDGSGRVVEELVTMDDGNLVFEVFYSYKGPLLVSMSSEIIPDCLLQVSHDTFVYGNDDK